MASVVSNNIKQDHTNAKDILVFKVVFQDQSFLAIADIVALALEGIGLLDLEIIQYILLFAYIFVLLEGK